MRDPLAMEKAIFLWVERMSRRVQTARMEEMRILSLYAVMHIAEGSGTFYTPPSGELEIEAGDSIYLFPDVPYAYVSDGQWSVFSIVFNGPLAASMETSGLLSSSTPVIGDSADIANLTYNAIEKILQRTDAYSIARKSLLIQQLICELSGRKESRKPENRLIDDVARFLEKHCAEKLSPPDVADHFGISYSHLRRLFKRHTGTGIKDFLTQKRVERAKRLLASGRTPVKRVAKQCGYDDVFLFMRVFKRCTGVPPGRFVKEDFL